MTPTPAGPLTLANLLELAFLKKDAVSKLDALCEVWRLIYNDLAWIEKFDRSDVSKNREELFQEEFSDLIPEITDKIAKKVGPNPILLEECVRNLNKLPDKINRRNELAVGHATRTAADIGAIYSQLVTLQMFTHPKKKNGSSYNERQAARIAEQILEVAVGVSTAVFTAIAVVDEGVTHAQHLVPLLIEISQEALNIEFVREIVIAIVRTIGSGMTF